MGKKRIVPYIIIIFFTAAFDLVTKKAALHMIKEGRKEFFNSNVFVRIVKNKGAAYNSFSNNPLFLKLLSGMLLVLATAELFVLPTAKNARLERAGLALLIGGGLGNWLDRLKNGSVTDFIQLKWKKSPVFNFADLFILWGVILYVIGVLKRSSKE